MSIVKMIKNDYTGKDAIGNVFDYCIRAGMKDPYHPVQWDGIGIYGYSKAAVIESMQFVKRFFKKEEGIQMHHMVVSIFKKNNQNNSVWANLIARDLMYFIYGKGYQNCYFKHTDSGCVHLHFIINSVNYKDGKMLSKVWAIQNEILEFLRGNYKELEWY